MTQDIVLSALMRVAEAYRAEHDAIRDPCECACCLLAAMCGVPTRGRKIEVDRKILTFIYKKLDENPQYAGPASPKPEIAYAIGYAIDKKDEEGKGCTDYAMAAGPVPDIAAMMDFVPDPEQEGVPMILKLSGDPFKQKNVVFTPIYQWGGKKWERIEQEATT